VVVGEESPGQRAGKTAQYKRPKIFFALVQYALSKTSQMRATALNT